ncbi:hypothetical protein N8940_00120 [Sphingomonadaceae bacterium]|nr:hypothetical protein [Sphingomonadaceae bacterium]
MMRMIIALIFALGTANFAMHKAVLESGHPLLTQLPGGRRPGRVRLTLVLEFLVLLAAMLLAANGWPQAAYAYLFYSAINALSAWLILSGRM